MEKNYNRHFKMRPALAACMCVVMVFACMGAAYAADIGGIQETLHVWIKGVDKEAQVIDNGDGSYTYMTESESVTGGGVAMEGLAGEFFGQKRPLTPNEVAENLGNEVMTDEDGNVILYYKGYAIDITDLLNGGTCKFALEEDGQMLYFDIGEGDAETGSYAFSRSTEPTGSASDYTLIK